MTHRYRFGIEEEYFLADRDTGRSPSRAIAEAYHRAAKEAFQVAEHELLLGQIEVSTEPGTDLDETLATLQGHRRDLSALAGRHNLLLFAAGSHPLALADEQHVSATERYERLGDELKLIAPQAPVSAMHVHVEVPNNCDRGRLTYRLMPFLQLMLALSVSSPFWEGRKSGLQGYRLTAFSQWPRAGLPNYFASSSQYDRYVGRLKTAGFVEDATFIWSHIRPSVRYPTVEMRVCDSCTRSVDAAAIAALYRALVRAMVRRPEMFSEFGPVEHALCGVNVWRAQQAGKAASFADLSADRIVTVKEMLEETLELTSEDFDELGMFNWPARLRAIVTNGTSADRQLKVYDKGESEGDQSALLAVVHSLAEETVA